MVVRSFGKLAVEAVRRSGSFASGRSYVQRYFPPGYREPAIKVIKAFEQAAAGAGLYQIYQELNTNQALDYPDGAQNGLQAPNKQYKTRSRFKRKPSSRYGFNNNYCKRCKKQCRGHSR